MTTHADALSLARRGLPVFRLKRGTKDKQVDADWNRGGATREPIEIFERFSFGEYNIGVLATDHVIVDVDNHGKVNGFEAFEQLEWPSTFTVRTPNGGLHLYFDAGGKRFGQRDLAPGINIRSTGGYVVGPGSEVGGKLYVIENDAPIARLPGWLENMLLAASDKTGEAPAVVGELDTPAAVESAHAFLCGPAPLAVEGCGGDACTYRVANHVLDRGVSPEMALQLMAEHWNPRCSPPWELDDLERKIGNAAQYRQAPVGRDNPAAGFEAAQCLSRKERGTLLRFPRDISLGEMMERERNAILKGLFRAGEAGLIYGESTAGKTFVALDVAFHVALGKPWHDVKVNQCPVLYVALEGQGGVDKRVLVASMKHGDPGNFFALLNVPVSLIKGSAGQTGAETIIQAYRELVSASGGTNGFIVIDTLARATAGDDENAASDMMGFIETRLGVISRSTGAATLVVHHTNKSGDIRGSTSIKASFDLVLRVERDGANRRVFAEKVKDGEERKLFDFELEQVPLGQDDEGNPVNSCILRTADPSIQMLRQLPKSEGKAVRCFRAAFDAALSAKPQEFADPETGLVVLAAELTAVRAEFEARYATGEADPKTSKETKARKWRGVISELPADYAVREIEGVEYSWRIPGPFEANPMPEEADGRGQSGFYPVQSGRSTGADDGRTGQPP